jgi:hypothetical protein
MAARLRPEPENMATSRFSISIALAHGSRQNATTSIN